MTSIIEYMRFIVIALSLGLGGCNGAGGSESTKPEVTPSASASSASVSKLVAPIKSDYRLPQKVSLCGEPLDLTKDFVRERLEFEFLRVVNHPAQVALWQRRAAVYFPFIEGELRTAGLPDDLKYLAMAESDLRPWIESPAGALGLWQFMPGTARHFGLTVSPKVDQRQLPEHLMGAAQRYFKSLYAKFGSWALAMAAYNAGDGRVAKAVSSQGTNNYFDLDLPRETERYVYRIAAIKVVMENAAHYGFTSPVPPEHYRTPQYTERTVEVRAGETWAGLAQRLGCDYKTFRQLNPHLKQAPTKGVYALRLPAGR